MAYSDIDGLDGYSTGDVLIARLMDTSGNGIPSAGDTVEMGRYPTTLNPTSADFESWTAGPHTVVSVYDGDPNPEDYIIVQTNGGTAEHGWYWRSYGDEHYERTNATLDRSYVTEAGDVNRRLLMDPGSPSKPSRAIGELTDPDTGDWFVIDVELNKGP